MLTRDLNLGDMTISETMTPEKALIVQYNEIAEGTTLAIGIMPTESTRKKFVEYMAAFGGTRSLGRLLAEISRLSR